MSLVVLTFASLGLVAADMPADMVMSFAVAARDSNRLPFVNEKTAFRNIFDIRNGTSGNVISQDDFGDAVAKCEIMKAISTQRGGYIQLRCPTDAAHGGGIVSYNIDFAQSVVSEVSLQVGPIVAISGSGVK